ncbi:MAG: hypothetical protein IPP71_00340 [Bacteroidetes bacterium]|nr:hypothetical protein [Bacteroidota bacterium]
MKLRIESTFLTIILCISLTFCASIMSLSEWYYKEDHLSPIGFKLLSLSVILAYVVSFSNLTINVFDTVKRQKEKLQKMYF